MYKITATILKPGGLPVEWMRMSKEKLTSSQCEKMLSRSKEVGKAAEEQVRVKNFKCTSCKPQRKVKRVGNGK